MKYYPARKEDNVMWLFKELDRYQKGVLILLAVMAVVFCVAYGTVTSRDGFLYKDEILLPAHENGNTVYSGTIDGVKASFTASSDKTITFRYGEKAYGPYTAKEDPTAIPKDTQLSAHMTGVEVRVGDEILFRGGIYQIGTSRTGLMIVNEDGSGFSSVVAVTSSGVAVDGDGNVIDPMEPSVTTVLKLMKGPELTHKGNWIFWVLGVFFSIVNTISILFADELFRYRLSFRIADADLAEPSEWELKGRYISWTIISIMILVCYIMGLQ